MIITNLESRDKHARQYLQESKEYAKFAAKDRERRTPNLTEEQREQLQNYLILMAQQPQNKDVYPYYNDEMKEMKRRTKNKVKNL